MEGERHRLMEHILSTDRRFYRSLRASGGPAWAETDLTMPQRKLLFYVVGSDALTMSKLARTLGTSLSTATFVVDRLIGHGLVRREADPHDRRLVLIRPTEEGTELIERLLQAGRSQFRPVLEKLDIESLRTVACALDLLYRPAESRMGSARSWCGRRALSRLDGRESVIGQVQKQSGTNTVAVADRVKRELDRLHKENPDLAFAIAFDQSTFTLQAVQDVQLSLDPADAGRCAGGLFADR